MERSGRFLDFGSIAEAEGHLARFPAPPPPLRRTTRVKASGATRGGVTLDEVADELGVSVQAAQITEKRALAKCKRWCPKHGYSVADLLLR